MVRKDGAEARKERIAKIASNTQAALYLNKNVGYISLKKTVAKHELETGLTHERIMEYLELLVDADQIEIDFEKDQIRRFSGV